MTLETIIEEDKPSKKNRTNKYYIIYIENRILKMIIFFSKDIKW